VIVFSAESLIDRKKYFIFPGRTSLDVKTRIILRCRVSRIRMTGNEGPGFREAVKDEEAGMVGIIQLPERKMINTYISRRQKR